MPGPNPEQSVIGATLITPKHLPHLAQTLQPHDFHTPAHETIWATILHLYQSDTPVDAITLTTTLQRQDNLQRVGGHAYIAELITACDSPANAPAHARIIREEATLRRLQAAATRIQQIATAGTQTPDALTAAAIAELENAHRPETEGPTLLADLIYPHLDTLESTDEPTGLTWPYADAHQVLNNLQPGQLVLIAARPAVGKSVTCVDIARHVGIKLGKTAVLHSLEMGADELQNRLIAAESRVSLSNITKKTLTADDWARISKTATKVQESKIHIVDNPATGINDIKASIKKYKPDVLILDYIQLASLNQNTRDRRQALEEFTRALKVTAKSAGIPIVCAAQLKRPSEQRQDQPPLLTDLRETGGLENDADVVVLLHRPDAQEPEHARAGEVDLIIAKQRGGPTGIVTLAHQMHYSRIQDMAR